MSEKHKKKRTSKHQHHPEHANKKHDADKHSEQISSSKSSGATENSTEISSKNSSENPDHQKTVGLALMLVGLAVLVLLFYFVAGKLLQPKSIAEFSPVQSTVFMAELTIDPNDGQVQDFLNSLKKYEHYQKENLLSIIDTTFSIDAAKDLPSWLGRKAGVIFMENVQQKGTLNPVLLVENRSQQETLNFFKRFAYKTSAGTDSNVHQLTDQEIVDDQNLLVTQQYKDHALYSPHYQDKTYVFTFLDNYVAIAANAGLLREIIDSKTAGNTLDKDPNYQKAAHNLPQGGLLFAYGNGPKFYQAMLKHPSLAQTQGNFYTAFEPFLSIFNGEGLSVSVRNGKVYAQTFSVIDREQFDNASYLTYSEKYRGKLLTYAEESPVLLLGGHNLYKELNRLEEIFQKGTKASQGIFKAFVEAQKQKYFGKDLQLEDDVYPLLKREYLAFVDNNFKEPQVSLIIQLADKNVDVIRIDKLIQAFITSGGFFEPKIQEVTLPDNTKGQEVVASPEQIEKSEEDYQGTPVTVLKIGNSGKGIYYSIVDDLWLISTQKETLERMMDRVAGKLKQNFKTTAAFQKYLEPISGTADELLYVKTGAFTDLLKTEENNPLKPYLEPFFSLSSSKNFFDDGISSIYTLEVL